MNQQIGRIDKGLVPQIPQGTVKPSADGESFQSVLGKFVSEVNSLQGQASETIDKLWTGQVEDVHQAMIAVNEAGTAMEFMLEIRNKIVEAYQEVMRMPI